MMESGAPLIHVSRTLERGRIPKWDKCLAWCLNAADRGAIVALVGKRGPGKTQIGVELIRDAIVRARSARYVRAQEIFMEVRETYQRDSGRRERQVVDGFVKPWLLVIDEAHDRGGTDPENRILNLILDRRYGDGKPTLIISNSTRPVFKDEIGPTIFDRLSETGGLIDCQWDSWRVKPTGE